MDGLDWLQSVELRQRVHAGLNKGEARNALARAVFFYRLGEIRDRSFEQQRYRASGLNLVTAAIVLWNTAHQPGGRLPVAQQRQDRCREVQAASAAGRGLAYFAVRFLRMRHLRQRAPDQALSERDLAAARIPRLRNDEASAWANAGRRIPPRPFPVAAAAPRKIPRPPGWRPPVPERQAAPPSGPSHCRQPVRTSASPRTG